MDSINRQLQLGAPSFLLIWVALPLLFVLGGCSSYKKQKEIALLHMEMGISHIVAGRPILALKELIVAEKLYPNSPEIHQQLGLAYFIRKKHFLAEKHLRKAIAFQKSYTEARNNLARVLISREKYREALQQVHLVLQDLTYTAETRAWNNKGLAHLNLGELKEAQKSFLRAIRLDPTSCFSHSYSGKTLYHLAKYKAAQKRLNLAIQNCQNRTSFTFDTPLYYSALNHYRLGHNKRARQQLKELILNYPYGSHHKKAKTLLEYKLEPLFVQKPPAPQKKVYRKLKTK